MSAKYLAIDSNIKFALSEAAVWAQRDIGIDRVDDMNEGIQKLMKGDYLYVGINSDVVNFMPLLNTMRSITHTPIMIATSNFTVENRDAAVSSGADLYGPFNKTTEGNISSVLIHIDHLIMRNKMTPLETVIMYDNDLLIIPSLYRAFIGNQRILLTTKEFDVLHLLMANREQMFSPEAIFKEVWKQLYDKKSKDVVWTLMRRLRQKLKIHPHSTEYIQTLREVGYMFDPR
jgi:two-component system copper resistance phosphate regulon response regulator CusR